MGDRQGLERYRPAGSGSEGHGAGSLVLCVDGSRVMGVGPELLILIGDAFAALAVLDDLRLGFVGQKKSETAAVPTTHATVDLQTEADVAVEPLIRTSVGNDVAVRTPDMDLIAHLGGLMDHGVADRISFVM